eukprot:1144853-Pelagomonas_calceolata.AAC.8
MERTDRQKAKAKHARAGSHETKTERADQQNTKEKNQVVAMRPKTERADQQNIKEENARAGGHEKKTEKVDQQKYRGKK